jgi:hypothetical protein
VVGEATGRGAVAAACEARGVPIDRIAWLVTVIACVVLAVLLLVAGYVGYAAISVAVGVAAAINLR